MVSLGVGARGGPPLGEPSYFLPRLRPGFRNPLFLDAWHADGSAGPWLRPMLNEVSRLLNASRMPMHPEALITAALAPLSHTLPAPVQQLLKLAVMPGSTPSQFPGTGAPAVAARLNAADMH